MKKANLKLALSIIAILIVLVLIGTGITVSFIGYKYNWNTKVDLGAFVPSDVTLQFEAKINDNNFVSFAEDGEFDNKVWEIPQEDTTFTKDNKEIKIEFKFINKCSSDLQIIITGIHYDAYKRFETYLTDEYGNRIDDSLIVKQADGKGVYTAQVVGGVDEYTIVNLNYKLIETTVPITGGLGDQQILSINISKID